MDTVVDPPKPRRGRPRTKPIAPEETEMESQTIGSRRLTFNPKNSFAKRMAIIASLAGSGQELANRSQISRRVIGLYLSGKADPSRERLVAMADAVGVNVQWLATGQGPMRGSINPERPRRGRPSSRPKVDFGSLADMLDTVGEGLEMMAAHVEQLKEKKQESATAADIPEAQLTKKDWFQKWLNMFWEEASERDRLWVEVQLEKNFPDYAKWVNSDSE